MRRYVFMLNATHEGYGGLEHQNSCALECARADLPRDNESQPALRTGYQKLLGVISHEYFHAWLVKRLRPAELIPYDYQRENYTGLLWLFEGFTAYYDDLLLYRAGLISREAYFRLLEYTLQRSQRTPGRFVHSPAQASFETWTKYYHPTPDSDNLTASYYMQGALTALCFDLTLRRDYKKSTDDLLRDLWRRVENGRLTEGDVAQSLQRLTGRSWAKEIATWVHGTGELPHEALLNAHGVEVRRDRMAGVAQSLGLTVGDDRRVIDVRSVRADSCAAKAGFAPGDEWLGIVGTQAWRITSPEDLLCYGRTRRVTALVSRDRRLLHLPLELPSELLSLPTLAAGNEPAAGRWPDAL